MDPRRLAVLRDEILDLAGRLGLDRDCGIAPGEEAGEALSKLDSYLCELKEMQIRDGLHVFGRSPGGEQLLDLLGRPRPPAARRGRGRGRVPHPGARPRPRDRRRRVRPPRLRPRGRVDGTPGPRRSRTPWMLRTARTAQTARTDQAARDSPDGPSGPGGADGRTGPSAPNGPNALDGQEDPTRPNTLNGRSGSNGLDGPTAPHGPPPPTDRPPPWRTAGDTVERLEALARALVGGFRACPASWGGTRAVLAEASGRVRPAVEACAAAEIRGVLTALEGRFVEPGPSGAPTRGRPDVLPTGRNFYSVDTRTVPTPAAWRLGWKSAALLVERHRQEQGEWAAAGWRSSAWGTSNMRTGGDDLAQALALMGVRPTWEPGSGRVTGFEVLPLDLLARPRVDVTLRVSGFFRDAFPAQVALFDAAARAVARLDEPARGNPLAAAYAADTARLAAGGAARAEAERRAGYRVFGARPGAYGAGLQALIDERGWRDEADLARAWIVWGGYAYGGEAEGSAEHRDVRDAPSRGGSGGPQPGQPRARPPRLRRLLPVRRGHGGGGASPVRGRARRSGTTTTRAPRARGCAGWRRRSPGWCAPGWSTRSGSGGSCGTATRARSRWPRRWTICSRSRRPPMRSATTISTRCWRRMWRIARSAPSSTRTTRPRLREIAERLAEAVERGLWRPRSNSAHLVLGELAGRRLSRRDLSAVTRLIECS